VKIPRLHELDLARIAPLDRARKRYELEQHTARRPPFTYNPFRSVLSDILNEQSEMFALAVRSDWTQIDKKITRLSKGPDELAANLEIGLSLFEYAAKEGMSSRRYDFYPVSFGSGIRVEYWRPTIISLGGAPLVPFFDPRRSRGLTEISRRFVFSMMHEQIRASDPDLATVRLGIYRFEPGDRAREPADRARSVRLFTDDSVPLYSMQELEFMISETYEVWQQVLLARRATRGAEERKFGGLF
jgi:hypothetical protein